MNARLQTLEVIEKIIVKIEEFAGILESSPERLANVMQEYQSLKAELQDAIYNAFAVKRITCSEYERLLKSLESMLDIPARIEINRVEDYNEGGKNGKTIFFAVRDAKQKYEKYWVQLLTEIENKRVYLKNIEGENDLFPKPNHEISFSFTLEDNNLSPGTYTIYVYILPLYLNAGITDKLWIEHVEMGMSKEEQRKEAAMSDEVRQVLQELRATRQQIAEAKKILEE